jgi:hypothetical protein
MRRLVVFSAGLLFLFLLNSCDEELNDQADNPFCLGQTDSRNLSQFTDFYGGREQKSIIACAASDKDNPMLTRVFFYPIPGANNYTYFEQFDIQADALNYKSYCEQASTSEPFFNAYLRFFETNETAIKTIVSYIDQTDFYVCDPIQLKASQKPTQYSDSVSIGFPSPTVPTFSWTDEGITDNVIYFQVISDAQGNLLSGTYTTEKTFTYNDFSNVVLDINQTQPPALESGKNYRFTLMAVSDDNWVNLVIEKGFSL